jgi:hypothetical protein
MSDSSDGEEAERSRVQAAGEALRRQALLKRTLSGYAGCHRPSGRWQPWQRAERDQRAGASTSGCGAC